MMATSERALVFERLASFWTTSMLLTILACAFALRLYALDREELGLDGYLSVGLASEQWPVFFNFLLRDPHPPLYYLALRGWLALSGMSFETARWLSVASGLVSIAVLARIARQLAGPTASIVAAILLALAPTHLYTSASVRDFGLGLALSLVALWLYPVRAHGDPMTRGGIVTLSLFTAAALLTWYFHVVILAMQATAMLFRPYRGDIAKGLAAGVLVAVPWLALSLPHLSPQFLRGENSQLSGAIQLGGLVRVVSEASFGVWPVLPWQWGLALVSVLIATAWTLLTRQRQRLCLFLSIGGTVLALLVTLSQ
jgi:uncharacterized membrane protein